MSKLQVLFFLFFSVLGTNSVIGQREVALSPPKQINLESPFKGETFRFYAYQYNINTNLNSNTISSLTIDTSGRVWYVAENSGFAGMDGKTLFTFGSHNGLFDRYKIVHADRFGRIWAGGNGIGVVSLDQSLVVKWYDKIGENISDVHISGLASDSKGNVWVSTGLGGVSCIKADTTLMYTPENSPLSLPATKFIHVDENDVAWGLCAKADSIFYIENEEFHWFTKYDANAIVFTGLFGNYQSNIIGLSQGGDLYEINLNGITKVDIEYSEIIPEKLTWANYDNNGVIYFGSSDQMFRLINGKAKLIINAEKRNFGISDVQFDNENRLWFSTRGYGIYFLPDPSIIRIMERRTIFSSPNIVISTIEQSNVLDKLEIDSDGVLSWKKILEIENADEFNLRGVLTAGVYLKERNGKSIFVNYDGSINPAKAKFLDQFYRIESYEGLDYLINENNEVYFDKGNGTIDKEEYHFEHMKVIHKENETYYFWAKKEGRDVWSIGKYEEDISILVDSIAAEDYRVTGVHFLSEDSYLVSTWGMYLFKITPDSTWNIRENLSTNILFISRSDHSGNYWTAGIEGGVNYVDGKSNSIVSIGDNDGLLGSKVNDIFIADNNDVIIATIKGIGHLRLNDVNQSVNSKTDFFKKYTLKFYSSKDGLWGEHFSSPFIDDEKRIWCGSRSGLSQVILPESYHSSPRHLRLEWIQKIDNKQTPVRLYSWLPATAYNPPELIELNYGEEISFRLKSPYFSDINELRYQYKINQNEWSLSQTNNTISLSGLQAGEYTVSFRAVDDNGVGSNLIALNLIVVPPFYQTWWFINCLVLIGLGIVFGVFRWRVYLLKLRQKELEETVEERTEEIRIQKIELETKHSEIQDSITYAKRIQEAILPPNALIQKCLPDSFVLYKPKDVVAGDFYWVEEIEGHAVFAAADCTGHGVPGAMVSVVCHNALVRSVREFGKREPQEILDKTRELVIERFEQGKQEVNDGMDISICVWNKKAKQLTYAGANNNLYHFRAGELTEYKADKQPIGKFHNPFPFIKQVIDLKEGDIIYVFTDGYADQFGGDKGKKFKSAHFKSLLQTIQDKSMKHQMVDIDRAFEMWRGELEQVDDVCIIGVRV